MRAGLRFGIAAFAAGLALGAPAHAQTAPSETETPASNSIGPREIQDFTLNGTVTRPADTPPAPAPAQAQPPAAASEPPATSPAEARRPAARTDAPMRTGSSPARPPAPPAVTAVSQRAAPAQQQPASSVTFDLPPPRSADSPIPASALQGIAAAPVPAPADGGGLPWPWLLFAAVLGGAAAFLLWRNRSREALAEGPPVDAFVAPEPPVRAPAQVPAAAPRAEPGPAPEPQQAGIVAARLRPWLDLSFTPLRLLLDQEQVALEFELTLFNSGSAPARNILVEAMMFNAGPTQDQDIGGFFANPTRQGQALEAIPPLRRMVIRNAVAAPRANIRLFDAGGRSVFIPLIAFTAIYRWSGGEGQSSVSYLFGRETKSDKLAPFKVETGAKAFVGLGARQLPTAVRS